MISSQQPVVLVVEDEPLILLNTVDELERAGFEVLEAANAALALRHLDHRSDITHLFSDIDLPGDMDGLRLAAIVRERWARIKIILTSGHMLPHTFILLDDTTFFPKPYRLSDIREFISQ